MRAREFSTTPPQTRFVDIRVSDSYPVRSTALVLVDPYNDFLDDDGLIWPRIRDVALSIGVREHLRDLLDSVRNAGMPVFIAPHRRWRPGDTQGWKRASRAHRALRDGHLYELGTLRGEWYPDLAPRSDEVVCSEHWGMNGFAQTDLDQQLRQHGVERIILAGLTAPGCVEGTGRYAMELGYAVTLVSDATAAFTAELQRAATELTGPLYSEEVISTAKVVDRLVAPSP